MLLFFLLILLLTIAWGLADHQLNAPIQRDIPTVGVAKSVQPPPPVTPPAATDPTTARSPVANNGNSEDGNPDSKEAESPPKPEGAQQQ